MCKLLAILFAFIYLVSVTGVTVHRHSCMGRPAGWGLFSDGSAVCPLCGMEKTEADNTCCKDETSLFKNTADQQGVISIWPVAAPDPVPSPVSFTDTGLCERPCLCPDRPLCTPAGPGISPPPYLLNGVFRI